MNFIKLTLSTGSKARINFDLVESYGTIDDSSYGYTSHMYNKFNGLTYVVFNGMRDDEMPYIVKETVEQIDELVKPCITENN